MSTQNVFYRTEHVPRLLKEAMHGLMEGYLYASTPTYSFSKMRDAIVKASLWMNHSNPPIPMPTADELYDTYQWHNKRTLEDVVIRYAVIAAVLDLPYPEAHEVLGMLDINGLGFGKYFVDTVEATIEANRIKD